MCKFARIYVVLLVALVISVLMPGLVLGKTVLWTGNAADGRLSNPLNWSGGVAPDAGDWLDFSGVASPAIINADFDDGRVFAALKLGSGVITLTGDLRVNVLTNAYTLAVASTGSLTVNGDLVSYAAKNTKPLLYSNEGVVTVGGKVNFRSSGTTSDATSTVVQYEVTNEKTTPIITDGLAYNADSLSDILVANLGSKNNGFGKWVVGAGGLTFPRSRNIPKSGFRINGSSSVALYSSADWELANPNVKDSEGALRIRGTGSVTISTSDYNDPSNGCTITFSGPVNSDSSHATPLTISGCGTLVVNSSKISSVNNTIAVNDTATLQVNAGKIISGDGKISFASGTRLLIPNASKGTAKLNSLDLAAGSSIVVSNLTSNMLPIELTGSMTLPSEGMAMLRIEGNNLDFGEYVVLRGVSFSSVDHLLVEGEAVVGRQASLYVEGGNLILKLLPVGFLFLVK